MKTKAEESLEVLLGVAQVNTGGIDVQPEDRARYKRFFTSRQRQIRRLLSTGEHTKRSAARRLDIGADTLSADLERIEERIKRAKLIGFADPDPLEFTDAAYGQIGVRTPLLAPLELVTDDPKLQTVLEKNHGLFHVRDLYTPEVLERGRHKLSRLGPRLWQKLNVGLADVGLPKLFKENSEAAEVVRLLDLKQPRVVDVFEATALVFCNWGDFSQEETARLLERGEAQVWPIIRIGRSKLSEKTTV